jgi:hypothetical protein
VDATASCTAGDTAVGGGFSFDGHAGSLLSSYSVDDTTWTVTFLGGPTTQAAAPDADTNTEVIGELRAQVICAAA